MRSFMGVVLVGTETVLSLHSIQTNKTRTIPTFAATAKSDALEVPRRHEGQIVLKNSCLIEGSIADSIPLLIGGFGDDGTKAGGASGAVL